MRSVTFECDLSLMWHKDPNDTFGRMLCVQRSNAFRYFNSKMVALPQGECNHKGEKRSKRERERLVFSECGRKMKEMEMPNGRGVECNPAVVARLHLFSEGSQVFMINDCGCTTAQDISGRFFLLIFLFFFSFFVWLWQKKGREGEVSQNGRASALPG